MIELQINGRPAPKGSRISKMTSTGKPYTYPASKYEKPWIDTIKREAQIVMRHRQTLEPPYEVELHFRLKAPQRSRRKYEWPVIDLDKLVRSTLDGLVAGNVIEDDRFVMALTASKRFARPNEETGVHVAVRKPAASAQIAA